MIAAVSVVCAEGVATTVNVPVPPAGIGFGESELTTKSGFEDVNDVTFNGNEPVFEIVNVYGAVGLPTTAEPINIGVVLLFVTPGMVTVACGAAVPDTDTFTVYGLAASLLGIVIVPVVAAVDVGVPETVNVAVPPAAIEPAGDTWVTVKPDDAEIVPTVNAAPPVFLIVKVLAALAVLITAEGNATAGVLLFATTVAPFNT